MSKSVRILYVDDYPLDRELVRDALEKEYGGFELVEAASRADFETALAQGGFDLVLSDFNILGFEGLQVLEAVRATDSPLPVIIVTGTGSEEVAAEAIKRGAADYVIKTPQHIQRLPHTIHAALEKKRLEDEHRQAEEALRESEARFSAIFHASPVAIAITRLADHQFVDVNAAWQAMTGYTRAEVIGHTPLELNLWVNPEQRQRLIETLRTQGTARDEVQVRRKSGEIGDVLMSADLIELAGERYLLTMAQDITARKQVEQKLAEQLDELRRWHAVTLSREGRVLELKHEVNELLRRLGEPIRYPSAEEQGDPKGLQDL
jgi:PAS domain S-box-containing protein